MKKGIKHIIEQKVIKVYDLAQVVHMAGLAKSKSEAKRLIEQGGVLMNGEKFTHPVFTHRRQNPRRISG